MNVTITISPSLWFEETMLGATLNYRSTEGADVVHFKVGMAFETLRNLVRSFSRPACLWTIRDGSLSVYGDYEQLTLTFCSVEGTLLQAGHALYGEELRIFKYAVNALAFRREVALN